MRAAAVVVAVLASSVAHAAPDDALANVTVVYARGGALYKSDARGKNEAQLVALPANKTVRALRTDARGTTLLADVGGKWSWMPLDMATPRLVALPCAEGPAQLSADGACVLCRSPNHAGRSIIVVMRRNKIIPVDVPPTGARLASTPTGRRLVWADAGGVWSSPPANPRQKTQLAFEAPLRSFLPSPDGSRALGVYQDFVFEGRQKKKPAELLMTFALDGQGARRKSIRDGVPVEWSHDGQWMLVQNDAQACIVKASGGQYKCFKGYTAVSIAPDGKFALVLGNRDAASRSSSRSSRRNTKQPKQTPKEQATAPEGEPEVEGGDDAGVHDDVAVPPPSGPLALYRIKLDGPFNDAPVVIARIVDGAAVWIPPKP